MMKSKHISRRRFLASGLVLAASSTLPVPFVFAQKGRSANEKLGVMVMGAGGRGGNHAQAMREDPRTVVLYICDPDQNRATKLASNIAEKQGVAPKVIADMREALTDPSLDIVTCASVNHWHTLCGIWALQAGKHVFLEKPISSNIHEGKAIVAAMEKYGRICQVGTQRRSNKGLADAVDFVRNGGLGDVTLVRGICYKRRKSIGPLGNYDVPKGMDYDLWCGPVPKIPLTRPNFHYDWHWQRHCGNGEIGNNGPHFCDLGRWFLGVERFPDRIFSYGGRVGYDIERKNPNYVDAGDTPNTHVSAFEFGDKTIVMECRGLETPKLLNVNFGAVVYGTGGYLTIGTGGESACTAYDNQGKEMKKFSGGGNHFKEFIDAVEKNDRLLVKADARCGALSAALCHLGNIAYYRGEEDKLPVTELEKRIAASSGRTEHVEIFRDTIVHLEKNGVDLKKTMLSFGGPLKLDAAKEVFVDDDAANKLMAREYRDGFVVPAPQNV